MIRTLLFTLFAFCIPIGAQAFERVSDKSAFIERIAGKSLTNRLYNVTLAVSATGSISGRAFDRAIEGVWSWREGYFCREMTWGDRAIPFNCQLVEARGNEMRFTSDQGAGASASFKLR
jgi:hypothetical protein